MPPLALTHLKYACAACAEALKSSGPVLPTTAPIGIGSPVAALPLFMPHTGLVCANAPPPASKAAANASA